MSNERIEMIDGRGNVWRDLIGEKAKDSKERDLGVVTDQYMDEGKPVFVIDDEYEICTFDVTSFIFPSRFIRFNAD